MAELTVSVIIPTFRRMDRLPACLAGVEVLEGRVEEVLIVYRPEDDPETANWLEGEAPFHSSWRLLPISVPGQVAAQNLALGSARSEIVTIFDDDAVPRPDWLQKVLPHFNRAEVAAAGGRDVVHGHNGPILQPTCARAGERDFWGKIMGNHNLVVGSAREVVTLKGCNWALRRAALGCLKFDERLPGKGAQIANDMWFCINLIKEGWLIVLEPSAIVDHYPATRLDYARNVWSRRVCYDTSVARTATELAFASRYTKVKHVIHNIFVGSRHCPGLYFLLHSLLKRPSAIYEQVYGGWPGYIRGFSLARTFRESPPGRAARPPLETSDR